MRHLQTIGTFSQSFGQRTDQPISGLTDPLPWLIRRLVKQQAESASDEERNAQPGASDLREKRA